MRLRKEASFIDYNQYVEFLQGAELIRCPYCGEWYNSDYDVCPCCGAIPRR